MHFVSDWAWLGLAVRVTQVHQLSGLWQKWSSAAGLQRGHPSTITVLAAAIPAAQPPLLSAINWTSNGSVWGPHMEDGGEKEEMHVFGANAVLLTAKTYAM